MVTRPGHSLPELIVAVTFLAATLVAVASTALLGARTAALAAERQAAVRLAGQVLDSVRMVGSSSGRLTSGRVEVQWAATTFGGVSGVTVTARAAGGGAILAEVTAASWPVLPVLGGGSPGSTGRRTGGAAP